MPGAEWTNDEPGDRDHHSPPLSGPEAAPSYPFVPVAHFDQAHAQPPEPAMAHVPNTPDHDETEPTETPAQPRKPLVTLDGFLAILKKIPRPSLGRERHEMHLDVNRGRAEPHSAEPEPARTPPKFPFLPMKRETRIGLATLFSFGVIVTALVVQRYTRSPVLALSKPVDEPSKEAKDKEKDEAKDKEESKNKDEAKPKEEAKAKSGPAVVESSESPQKLPVDIPVGKPQLAGDVKTKEPEVLPKSESPAANVAEAATKSATPPDPIPSGELELPTLAGAGSGPPTQPAGAVAAANPPASEPVKLPSTTATATPNLPADLPVVASDPKPALPVLNPEPAPAPVAIGGAAPAAESLPQVAPATPEPVANPSTALNPVTTATAPVPSANTPPLDPVPPASPTPPPSVAPAPIEPAATPTSMGGISSVAAPSATSTAALVGAGWMVVQSGGRRIPGTGTIVSTPADSELSQPSPTRIADRPRSKPLEDQADSDQIEPVFHKVRSGENFWTISKLYYNSNRYYKALHAANQQLVPDITKLYVGTVLKIPPPEKLDRNLIERETVTRTTKKVDSGDLADLAPPVRPRPRPDAEAVVEAPRRPTYKVRARDTLRTIARDTLNDSTRDREIFDLNRDVLDNPRTLPVGTILVLPEDASTGRVPR